MARSYVARQLERAAVAGRCGGRACVTDNGNHILDVHGLAIDDPMRARGRRSIGSPGVVTVGLFARRPADLLIVGTERGIVEI